MMISHLRCLWSCLDGCGGFADFCSGFALEEVLGHPVFPGEGGVLLMFEAGHGLCLC